MVTKDTLPPFDKPKLSKVRRGAGGVNCSAIDKVELGYLVAVFRGEVFFFSSGTQSGQRQRSPPLSGLLSAVRNRGVDTERGEANKGDAVTLTERTSVKENSASQVVSVDTVDKAVELNDGSSHNYDQLLISTGCRFESECHFRKNFLMYIDTHTCTHTRMPFVKGQI